ncbi:MurR/RpiR family transcriptional regulator [Streptomyces smaragdinus]|uniref:MurR/RpiR family transcriptional regulator n=1 Tax=Streptomyces smaragdinus TaxID=2585196 RepID=UPI001886A6CF|nr:MurR/RpiR family transcriptional regulator [Streptomyces smaragdinus]
MSQIVDRIRELEPGLPEAQRTLAALILADPGAVAARTILELAETAGVSTGSITRLCRTLGLAGYSQLRLALAAADPARTVSRTWQGGIGAAISEHDALDRVAEAVVAAVAGVVAEAVRGLDLRVLEEVALRIAAARRVELFGVGGSGTTAAEFQQRLYGIGIPAWIWTDAHIALTGAALLGPDDVVVAVSHTGATREPRDVLAEAASRGATTVAVTNDPDAPLARHADLALATRVRATGVSSAALARHAQMAVFDVLHIAVAQRTYDRTTQAMAASQEAVRPYRDAR